MEFAELLRTEISTTEFELKNFIVGAQLSPHRKLRQIVLEGNVREDNITNSGFDLSIANSELAILKEELDEESNLHRGNIISVEINRKIIQIENIKKQIKRNEKELSFIEKEFVAMDSEFGTNIIEEILLPSNENEAETNYWIERLSRQASNDVIATGRISTGNIDAILNLPDNIKGTTLIEAIRKTGIIEDVIKEEQLKISGTNSKE